jgi:hypothetical protein
VKPYCEAAAKVIIFFLDPIMKKDHSWNLICTKTRRDFIKNLLAFEGHTSLNIRLVRLLKFCKSL